MRKLKKHILSTQPENSFQETKIVAAPKIFKTDGSRCKITNLYDPRNLNQRKRFVELAFYKWEFIRRNDKYCVDYKKHFLSLLVAVPSGDNQLIFSYFRNTYAVSIPINPDYSFREIFKQCRNEPYAIRSIPERTQRSSSLPRAGRNYQVVIAL